MPRVLFPPRPGSVLAGPLALSLLGLLGLAAPGRAQERPPAFQAPSELRDFTVEDEELEEVELPRIRLELWGRGGGLGATWLKKGPHYNAHKIDLHKDTRLPRLPVLGVRLIAEVRFHEDWLVGVHATGAELEGPRRRLHHRGVFLQGRALDPSPSRTRVEFAFAEAYVRIVFRDNRRIRLMLGTGIVWTSFRLQIANEARRADGRIEELLGPSVGYYFSFALHPRFLIWVESTNALIAPHRFPAYASEVRAGFRLPLGDLELAAGVGISSVQLEDARDLWGGKHRPATYRWRRASWSYVSLDLGLAYRF